MERDHTKMSCHFWRFAAVCMSLDSFINLAVAAQGLTLVSPTTTQTKDQLASDVPGPETLVKVPLEHNLDLRRWGIGYNRPSHLRLSEDEPPQDWLLPPIDSTTHRRLWGRQKFGHKTVMNSLAHTPHDSVTGPWKVFVSFDENVDFRRIVPVSATRDSPTTIEFDVAYENSTKQPYAIRVYPTTFNPNSDRYYLSRYRYCIRTGTVEVRGNTYEIALVDDDNDGLYSDLSDTTVLLGRKTNRGRFYGERMQAVCSILIGSSDYFTVEAAADGSSALLRPAAYGILEGLITKRPANTAISGARVKLTPYEVEVLTDPNGRYQMRLPAGRYMHAEITAQGYIPEHILQIPEISPSAVAELNVTLDVAQAPQSGEVTLYQLDSFHFLSGQRYKLRGGDFYLTFSNGQPQFKTNAGYQRGLTDLGAIESPLDTVTPPTGRPHYEVPAVVGHVYASLAKEGETGCHIIFKVTKIEHGQSCTLAYYYRHGEPKS